MELSQYDQRNLRCIADVFQKILEDAEGEFEGNASIQTIVSDSRKIVDIACGCGFSETLAQAIFFGSTAGRILQFRCQKNFADTERDYRLFLESHMQSNSIWNTLKENPEFEMIKTVITNLGLPRGRMISGISAGCLEIIELCTLIKDVNNVRFAEYIEDERERDVKKYSMKPTVRPIFIDHIKKGTKADKSQPDLTYAEYFVFAATLVFVPLRDRMTQRKTIELLCKPIEMTKRGSKTEYASIPEAILYLFDTYLDPALTKELNMSFIRSIIEIAPELEKRLSGERVSAVLETLREKREQTRDRVRVSAVEDPEAGERDLRKGDILLDD